MVHLAWSSSSWKSHGDSVLHSKCAGSMYCSSTNQFPLCILLKGLRETSSILAPVRVPKAHNSDTWPSDIWGLRTTQRMTLDCDMWAMTDEANTFSAWQQLQRSSYSGPETQDHMLGLGLIQSVFGYFMQKTTNCTTWCESQRKYYIQCPQLTFGIRVILVS
jgi:hypothetical protein